MTPVTSEPSAVWALQHPWQSAGDLAALDGCRPWLQAESIELQGGALPAPAAVKQHGMPLLALGRSARPPLDLHDVAQSGDWQRRVPAFMRRYMQHGAHWHGIPMGIHQGNCAWVNRAVAERIGTPAEQGDLARWLALARRITPTPLALSMHPWQIGVLFESLVLAHSAELYQGALVQRQAKAWLSSAMRHVLRTLAQLRDHANEATAHLSWEQQMDRVKQGQAALLVMGDWARTLSDDTLVAGEVPAASSHFVAIMDFFTPLRGPHESISMRAAAALTHPRCQAAFARLKGCMPAVADAWLEVDAARAGTLQQETRILPSWTFEQCMDAQQTQRSLEALHRHVRHRGDAADTAAQLAALCCVVGTP